MWKRTLSMPNVLFEIGLEEVPARFVDNCLADLKTILEKALIQVRLMDMNTEKIYIE